MNVLLLSAHDIDGQTAIIQDADQVAHIKHVLNAAVGDTLKVGELGGKLGAGVIDFIDDKVVLREVRLDAPPPAKLGVTLVLALPRPKVLRRLIMDMTAIGVNHIVLVNSYRTDKSYWGSPLLARLDEFVQEGLQQGVDTIAPKITLAKRFKPFVQDELLSLIRDRAVVCHPYADENFYAYSQAYSLPDLIVIGAEGGFIPYEIELLASVGVTAVGLGQRILRTESAVNAVLGRYLS